ncbi:hypothetical protein [Brevundimonas sp.]|uniref:hypothetical protein n=1 Tax=Brevundimonas sp. TaxID=1871086 RepID=UPI0035147B0F
MRPPEPGEHDLARLTETAGEPVETTREEMTREEMDRGELEAVRLLWAIGTPVLIVLFVIAWVVRP